MENKIPEQIKHWIKQGGIAAVLTLILTFAINWKQESRIDYDNLLNRQAASIEKLEAKVGNLEDENRYLHSQLNMLASVTYEMPVPMWVKSLDGRMLNLNQAYEDMFLIPNGLDKIDYIGKTDEEMWSQIGLEELARKYRAHDLTVIRSREVKQYTEVAVIDGEEMQLSVYKFPYWSGSPNWNGKKVMGVGGIAIPKPCD